MCLRMFPDCINLPPEIISHSPYFLCFYCEKGCITITHHKLVLVKRLMKSLRKWHILINCGKKLEKKPIYLKAEHNAVTIKASCRCNDLNFTHLSHAT